jgi:hypothetical protein
MADVDKALAAAVGAIYFNDGADYLTALWQVVKALSPEIYELLQTDEGEAYKRTHPEAGDE